MPILGVNVTMHAPSKAAWLLYRTEAERCMATVCHQCYDIYIYCSCTTVAAVFVVGVPHVFGTAGDQEAREGTVRG